MTTTSSATTTQPPQQQPQPQQEQQQHHPSIQEFLRQGRQQLLRQQQQQQGLPPDCHVVIGNPAGDADSIVSAIAAAYVDHVADNAVATTTTIGGGRGGGKTAADDDDPPVNTPAFKLPIVSIPKVDLETQRPETMLLLEMAGIDRNDLVFVNEDDGSIPLPSTLSSTGDNDNHTVNVTLVDHNSLAHDIRQDYQVVEILDHHLDMGRHTDTCPPLSARRNIAFDPKANPQALVASTCTLVVERLVAKWFAPQSVLASSNIPASLSILLLGVVLLDSINMLPQAGKGTPRDEAAINVLMDRTDWKSQSSDLNERARKGLNLIAAAAPSGGGNSSGEKKSAGQPEREQPSEATKPSAATAPNTVVRLTPDRGEFFDALQRAKFDPEFWKSLSVRDALRLDYKPFAYHRDNDNDNESAADDFSFGVSTVLISLSDFAKKPRYRRGIVKYMEEQEVDFFGIMLTFVDQRDGSHRRQLVLCCNGSNDRINAGFPLKELVGFLERAEYDQDSLELAEIAPPHTGDEVVVDDDDDDDCLMVRFFDQRNSKASRKQVVPILFEFLKERSN